MVFSSDFCFPSLGMVSCRPLTSGASRCGGVDDVIHGAMALVPRAVEENADEVSTHLPPAIFRQARTTIIVQELERASGTSTNRHMNYRNGALSPQGCVASDHTTKASDK